MYNWLSSSWASVGQGSMNAMTGGNERAMMKIKMKMTWIRRDGNTTAIPPEEVHFLSTVLFIPESSIHRKRMEQFKYGNKTSTVRILIGITPMME